MSAPVQPHLPTLAGRAYRCQCGCPVFFRNSACLACGTPLGYDPEQARLLPLMAGTQPDTWVVWHDQSMDQTGQQSPVSNNLGSSGHPENTVLPPPALVYTRCANLQTPA
ncbi:MAG: zinc-ribbon domain-containing protein, partial [Ferruginibacter sp.]|nr:zinc-ribbon domain-containing protein [Rhodoferax sp.]